ncbi:MAG: Arc family DNA-binding protein [Agrobacterium cavarae]
MGRIKVKNYDQFQLRLPPGMRDRIKAKAERAGMSMNEAIVWVLEKEFPAQVTFDERIEELANLVSMLKDSKNPDEGVEYLISEVEETLTQISRRMLQMDSPFRQMVAERVNYWQELEMDNWRERNESPFNDEPPFQGEGNPYDLEDGVPLKDRRG